MKKNQLYYDTNEERSEKKNIKNSFFFRSIGSDKINKYCVIIASRDDWLLCSVDVTLNAFKTTYNLLRDEYVYRRLCVAEGDRDRSTR